MVTDPIRFQDVPARAVYFFRVAIVLTVPPALLSSEFH